MSAINWAIEFSQIISCTRCTTVTCNKLLRDDQENVPQPGFIGDRFPEKQILLAGQNPGIATAKTARDDQEYTAFLRAVRDGASAATFGELQTVLRRFVPTWPVCRSYFPFEEAGLTLDEVAYCNVVRCRTHHNAPPSKLMVSECTENHFSRWLDILRPRAVVFIGKLARDRGARFARDRQIPFDFMNRERSLPSEARVENRNRVVAFVKASAAYER
ncbi:MAG: uracil-DNA glycosylase family protein [Rhizomicrobium sp.]|jgi:uracil-DNA glycosylase